MQNIIGSDIYFMFSSCQMLLIYVFLSIIEGAAL